MAALNFKQILKPAQVDDVEAAQRRAQLAEALQQRAMQGNPMPAGGAVQAKYGAGNALVDLANSLAASWNLKNADAAYGRAKEAKASNIQQASDRLAISQPNMPLQAGQGEVMSPLTPEEGAQDLGRAMGPEGQAIVTKALLERKLSETDPVAIADRELKAYQISGTLEERRAAREDRATLLREQIAAREQAGKDAADLRRELAGNQLALQREIAGMRSEDSRYRTDSTAATAAAKTEAAAAKGGPDVTAPESAQEFLRIIKDKDGNDAVEALIKKSTGSGIGWMVDKAGEAVGMSTKGAQAGAALGSRSAELVRNLLGGKYGAGISNADREAMERLAAKVDDTHVPRETRLAAWRDLKSRMELAGGARSGAIQRPAAPELAAPAGGAGDLSPDEAAELEDLRRKLGR